MVLVGGVLPLTAGTAATAAPASMHLDCSKGLILCTEVHDSEAVFGDDVYVGHDEPSVLFYDDHRGAGNNASYLVRLPKDPPHVPNQQGTGGTFNFQLHPAIWFGMALCDNQSAPEFTHAPCTPDSDTNIFDSGDVNDPHYIGKHPGTAFMELQFYPPGWVAWPPGASCDATKWCVALAIFSLSLDQNTVRPTTPTASTGPVSSRPTSRSSPVAGSPTPRPTPCCPRWPPSPRTRPRTCS
jgi:hypothetical protein